MTDRNLAHLHADLQPLCRQFIDQCKAQQIEARVTCTYRSAAEQDRLFASGRDASGKVVGKIVTKARGGQSQHNTTLNDGTPASRAFDFVVMNDDGSCNWNPNTPQWKAAVAIGKALGLAWGGDFPAKFFDACHFQLP